MCYATYLYQICGIFNGGINMTLRVERTRKIVVTGMLISLALVLSLITVFKLPLGGSITLLSMLPIAMISIKYGIKWGVTSAFFYSLMQLVIDLGKVFSWGLSPFILISSILLDYIFAYTVLGFSGIFRKYGSKGICMGIFIALFIRFLCHFISGAFIFSFWCPDGWNAYFYSICYNGTYMLPETIFTMIGAVSLFRLPQINNIMFRK